MLKYELKDDGFCDILKEENGEWIHKFDVFPESEALNLVNKANKGKKTDYDNLLWEDKK